MVTVDVCVKWRMAAEALRGNHGEMQTWKKSGLDDGDRPAVDRQIKTAIGDDHECMPFHYMWLSGCCRRATGKPRENAKVAGTAVRMMSMGKSKNGICKRTSFEDHKCISTDLILKVGMSSP